jgi:hypothetical protein
LVEVFKAEILHIMTTIRGETVQGEWVANAFNSDNTFVLTPKKL